MKMFEKLLECFGYFKTIKYLIVTYKDDNTKIPSLVRNVKGDGFYDVITKHVVRSKEIGYFQSLSTYAPGDKYITDEKAIHIATEHAIEFSTSINSNEIDL